MKMDLPFLGLFLLMVIIQNWLGVMMALFALLWSIFGTVEGSNRQEKEHD